MDEFRFEQVVHSNFFHLSVEYANVNMNKPLRVAVFLEGFEEINSLFGFTDPWERLESIMARFVNLGHDDRLVGQEVVITIRLMNVCGYVSNGIPWIHKRICIGFETFEMIFLKTFSFPLKFDNTQTYAPKMHRPTTVDADVSLDTWYGICTLVPESPVAYRPYTGNRRRHAQFSDNSSSET